MVAKAAAKKRSARTAGRAKAAPAKRAAVKKPAAKKAAVKKPAGAKKAAAKKTPVKKAAKKAAAPAKKTAAPAKPVVIDVESLIYRLVAAAAERDASVVYGALAPAAIDGIGSLIRPYFGTVQFTPPPSYRKFMAAFGSLRALDEEGLTAGFYLYTPREVAAQTREFVFVPRDVKWEDEDGREYTLTTNHLIAFADAGGEWQWCFDTSTPGPGGELPVCLHHQDEPVYARRIENGKMMSSRPHDYPDFLAWLIGQIEEFCAPPRKRR